MSLLSWLSKGKRTYREPQLPGLPDPNECPAPVDAVQCEAANEQISTSVREKSKETRKRGPYTRYTPEQRLEMARFAALHGVVAASRHFSKEYGKKVTYTTIQSLVPQYKAKVKAIGDPQKVMSMAHAGRGRNPLLGATLDNAVIQHLRAIRSAGGIVSRTVTRSTALGIIRAKKPSLLPSSGGTTLLSDAWCNSIHRRIDFTKRKGTKAAKKLPSNFDELKTGFLERISTAVRTHHIPPELIVNVDETGLAVVPVSNWTLAERGSKDVSIMGIDDKRQITAVVASTPAGQLLPPQLIYQGKTTQCHPAGVVFPSDWDIWHSESHWSTHDTIKRYIKDVLKPHADKVRQQLDLPPSQRALLIFDVYAAHRTPDVIEEIGNNGFELVYVPANCTSELQPLDLSVNAPLKESCKSAFSDWYAGEVCSAIQQAEEDGECDDEALVRAVEMVRPDLRLSVLKPLHAKWMIDAFAAVTTDPSQIKRGWEAAGITQSLLDVAAHVEPGDGSDADTDMKPIGELYSQLQCATSSLVEEFFLPFDQCQSRLDGRSMSHACTVISSLVVEDALTKRSLWSECNLSDLTGAYTDIMRAGNTLYDDVFGQDGAPFLSTYDVVCKCSQLSLRIPQHGEIGFVASSDGSEKVKQFLEDHPSRPAGMVYTSRGRSVAVVFDGKHSRLFDSHAHHSRGALIAAAPEEMALLQYLYNIIPVNPVRGASITFLDMQSSE